MAILGPPPIPICPYGCSSFLDLLFGISGKDRRAATLPQGGDQRINRPDELPVLFKIRLAVE